MKDGLAKPGERIDDLGRNGYRILTKPDRFSFGIDAVLLSWFAKRKDGESVVDLCSGNGIVPLLMDARNPGGRYVAVEIQKDMAELADRSFKLNRVADRLKSLEADAKTVSEILPKHAFDVVTANPPYIRKGSGLENPCGAVNVARHEILITLSDVVREAAALLKPHGRFYMVHRPERLPEILKSMEENRLKPRDLILVLPHEDRNANLVLVEGVKDGRNELKALPPIVVYDKAGNYTETVRKIYQE